MQPRPIILFSMWNSRGHYSDTSLEQDFLIWAFPILIKNIGHGVQTEDLQDYVSIPERLAPPRGQSPHVSSVYVFNPNRLPIHMQRTVLQLYGVLLCWFLGFSMPWHGQWCRQWLFIRAPRGNRKWRWWVNLFIVGIKQMLCFIDYPN